MGTSFLPLSVFIITTSSSTPVISPTNFRFPATASRVVHITGRGNSDPNVAEIVQPTSASQVFDVESDNVNPETHDLVDVAVHVFHSGHDPSETDPRIEVHVHLNGEGVVIPVRRHISTN